MIEEGKKIPKFSLPDQSGEQKKFEDLAGKNGLVLYFYPKDNTPGCTLEGRDFSAALPKFKHKGFNVVGVSKDSVKSHCSFTDKQGLQIQLLSDPDTKMIEAFGAWREKKNYGKVSMGTVRSTYVIDSGGKVLKAYDNVKAKGHVEQVLEDIAKLEK